MDKRLKISIALICCSIPLIITETASYTYHFRDVFFFADANVANHILETGHSNPPLTEDQSKYWGKIETRSKQPVLPIFMAVGAELTGLHISVFRGHLPIYLAVAALYFVISRRFVDDKVALVVALAGSVGPNMKPATAAGGRALKYVFILLLIWMLIYRIENRNKPSRIVLVTGAPIVLFLSLFNYPRYFVLGVLILAFSAIFVENAPRIDYSIILALAGGYVIFTIPYDAYVWAFGLVLNVAADPLSLLEQASAGAPETAFDSASYTRYTAPIPFLVGGLGGIVTLRKVLNDGKSEHYDLLFAWGIALALFGAMHLATGVGWIVGRVYSTGWPIMVVGVAIGCRELSQYDLLSRVNVSHLVAVLFLVSVLASFGAIANSQWMDIHTYTEQEATGANWIDDYDDGTIVSDTKQAALITQHNPVAEFPREEGDIRELFYSENQEDVRHQMRNRGGKYLLISTTMETRGFYVSPYPREPITDSQHSTWGVSMNKIHDNGVSTTYHYNRTGR